MKKTLLFCGIFAIAAFNFLSCDDEDDNNNSNSSDNGGATTSNLSAEFVGASDCLNNAMDGIDNEDATRTSFLEAKSSISYKFDSANGELELILQDAKLNCFATPKMDIRFSGDTIIFNPYNASTGDLARCFCIFNLTSKVKGAESKVYYIRPEELTDVEDVQVLELSQKNEGVVYFSEVIYGD
ncbi:MAG: hypothetical protein K6E14_04805 [Paludibacteraceae bacterium]|nr:hypothetical protein [Paludibacteraceae bacterium]